MALLNALRLCCPVHANRIYSTTAAPILISSTTTTAKHQKHLKATLLRAAQAYLTAVSPSPIPTAQPANQLNAQPPTPAVNHGVYHLDTWRMTRYLKHRGFSTDQSIGLTHTIHDLLINAFVRAQADLITKTDVDNETYLYKAAISELGLELKIMRQNDHSIIKSELSRIAQDLESLLYLSRDDISTIKSDLLIDLNNRKSEIRDDVKRMDLRIQQVNNKMTVMCSDIKTDIEMMKFDATKTVLVWAFVGAAGFLVVIATVSAISRTLAKPAPTSSTHQNKPSSSPLMLDSKKSSDSGSSSSGSGADTVIIVEAGHGKKFL